MSNHGLGCVPLANLSDGRLSCRKGLNDGSLWVRCGTEGFLIGGRLCARGHVTVGPRANHHKVCLLGS